MNLSFVISKKGVGSLIQKFCNKQWASAVLGLGATLVNEIAEGVGADKYSGGQGDSEGRPCKRGCQDSSSEGAGDFQIIWGNQGFVYIFLKG